MRDPPLNWGTNRTESRPFASKLYERTEIKLDEKLAFLAVNMATQHQDRAIHKILVKNLPEKWSSDHLVNFLEVETCLGIQEIEESGPDLSHVIVLLESPVSEETVNRSNYGLKPFCGHTLTLEAVQESPLDSCSLLVRFPDPAITRDHLTLCLDNIGEVLDCQTHAQTCLAFVRFQSPEDAQAVLKMSDLRISGKPLKVEPWMERSHRSLLQPQLREEKTASLRSNPGAVSNAFEENRQGNPSTSTQVDDERPGCNFSTGMQAYGLSSKENYTTAKATNQYRHDGCGSENSPLRKGNPNNLYNNNEMHNVHINVRARQQTVAGSSQIDHCMYKGQLTSMERNRLYSNPAPEVVKAAKTAEQHFAADKNLDAETDTAKGQSTQSKTSSFKQSEDEPSSLLCPRREEDSQGSPARCVEPESEDLDDLNELMQSLSFREADIQTRKTVEEGDGCDKERSREDSEHLKMEIERLKQQLEASKQPVAQLAPVMQSEKVPRHMIRPLKEFMNKNLERISGTRVEFCEKDEKVVFAAATEKECVEAKERFFVHFQQNIYEKTIPVSEEIMKVLKKERGRKFLDRMISRYNKCGIDVCKTCLQCAALRSQDMEVFEREFESTLVTRTLQIPINVMMKPEFQVLKNDLEQTHLVDIGLPSDVSTTSYGTVKVGVAGVSQDVAKVGGTLEEFSRKNKSSDSVFVVDGRMQGKAVKLWFQKELDQAKQLILKNGGASLEKQIERGYCLQYRCPQQILPAVVQLLDVIREGIVRHTFNLNTDFTETTEYILVVNGLLDLGINSFADRFQDQLERSHLKGLVDFVLPRKCHIPRFGRPPDKESKTTPPKRGEDRGGERDRGDSARPHPRGRGQGCGEGRRELRPPQLPYSLSVGKTVVTLKSGDITSQQVEAAVSVIGVELEMENCALGKAFMMKCPQLAQMFTSSRSKGKTSKDPGAVITTEVPQGSNLTMSVVFHAVLAKLEDPMAVTQTVQKIVRSCLNKTAKKGLKSIALPPLGVGRRFGFGRYTTASAIMTSVQEFLRDKPDSITDITIVVGDDEKVQDKFAQALQKTLGSAQAGGDNSSNDGFVEKVKNLWQKVAANFHIAKEQSPTPEVRRDRFEATIYTTKTTDVKKLKDMLVEALRSIFLHSETIEEKDCIHSMRESLDNLTKEAIKVNVIITSSKKGLTVSGQKERVMQVVANIRKEMYVKLDQRQKADQSARQQLALPTDTDHMPSYWKVRQEDRKVTYREAILSWQRRGVRTNRVTEAEFSAVKRLVAATWDRENVGQGADARGLTHSGITVVDVKRLENPVLWKEYSHKRDQLIDDLVRHHQASHSARCSPVDKLPGSRGPVLTMKHIKKGDPLAKDIFPVEINEHYLFHGTKKEIVGKICSQGMDFRLNSSGMLGKGIYLAECPTKSDQYADNKNQRSGRGDTLTMLLVRVLLGHPYLHKAQTPTQFKRPPCMSCKDEFCRCPETRRTSRFYNSVIDDCRKFREFVVYGEHLCYPEYIIAYKREWGRASTGRRK